MSTTVPDPPTKSRILIASCNSQQHENVLWDNLASRNASAFVWSGDAVYGDDFQYTKQSFPFTKKEVKEATPHVLQSLYSDLLQESRGYTRLREVTPQILGAFDDHDYGRNNGDATYQYRQESAVLFVDFLQQSNTNHSRHAVDLGIMHHRAQTGEGVYGVKVLDFRRPKNHEVLSDQEAGLETDMELTQLSDRTVAIFLLDCRSHKTPWKTDFFEKYQPDYTADFLGETQWKWLQSSLNKSTATVNVIVNGLQVHADRFFDGSQVESWSRFPTAQHRLYQTILDSGASAPVLVSGDVHMAELSLRYCQQRSPSSTAAVRRPLFEMTSSGMTHSWCYNVCARPSQSFMCRNKWVQYALCIGMHWAHINPSWSDVLDYSLERNFGEFEFDWENRQLVVNVFGIEQDAPPLIRRTWGFDALSGTTSESSSRLADSDYRAAFERLDGHGGREMDWWCVNHAGDPSLALKVFGVISPVSLALCIFWSPVFLLIGAVMAFLRRSRQQKTKLKHS